MASIPHCVSKAIRSTINGRPGVAYLDLPGDLLRSSASLDLPKASLPKATIVRPLEAQIIEAVDLLSKGCIDFTSRNKKKIHK